jgi:hypothetical protein
MFCPGGGQRYQCHRDEFPSQEWRARQTRAAASFAGGKKKTRLEPVVDPADYRAARRKSLSPESERTEFRSACHSAPLILSLYSMYASTDRIMVYVNWSENYRPFWELFLKTVRFHLFHCLKKW